MEIAQYSVYDIFSLSLDLLPIPFSSDPCMFFKLIRMRGGWGWERRIAKIFTELCFGGRVCFVGKCDEVLYNFVRAGGPTGVSGSYRTLFCDFQVLISLPSGAHSATQSGAGRAC